MQLYKILIISLFTIGFFTSCEDVIELDLENSAPQTVIEGTIDMTAQTARVIITQTNGFYDEATPVPVENAVVELASENGTTYTLSETEPGIFEVSNLSAAPEQHFRLSVEANGEIYEADAIAPFPVDLTEISSEEFEMPFDSDASDETSYQIFATWEDQPDKQNFYRVRPYRDENLITNHYTVLSDEVSSQSLFKIPIRREIFESGEEVRIELLSTDEAYHDYFLEVASLNENGFGGATPFNPQGNFSNGALGYFGIYSTSSQKLKL